MADSKLTALSAITAASGDDLLYVVDDPGGTPASKKITVTNFFTSPTLVTPALGTPASGVMTNVTGTAAGLTAGAVTGFTAGAGVLTGPASAGVAATLGNAETITGAKTFGSAGAVSKLKVAGTTSGAVTLDTEAVAGSAVITIPAVTDQLVGRATTDTLTNKTLTSPVLTTPSAFTTGGTITLAENTSVALDPAGSADGKFTGITVTGTAGYSQAFGDYVYLDPTDSRWEAVDANAAAGADGDARGLTGMVVVTGTDGTACTILLQGIIRADAKFPALTIGAQAFASETAGAIVTTKPTTTDAVVRCVGSALTADELYFNPSPDFYTAV